MSLLRPIAALLIASLCLALPAQAERRVALVMGNGQYLSKNVAKLPNPPADAEAMAAMLKSLGFEVVLGIDLSRDAMADNMNRFAQLAGGADVALFFYAGHAFQLDGKNLLVPVDAEIKNEFDAKQRTIEIDSVLQYTMESAKVKLVLLDGCRDNPFAKQIVATAPKTRNVVVGSGLAEMRPGEGTLIAFATGPGQVALDGEGTHSPFTRALLKHLPTPELEISHALTRVRAQVADDTRKQQLPWANTNMTGFFYMKAPDTTVAAVTPQAAPTPEMKSPGAAGGFDERALDLEMWSSVKNSKDPEDYRLYLARFPNGTFADLARSRAAALSRPAAAPVVATAPMAAAPVPTAAVEAAGGDIRTAEASKATEDALGLSIDAWKEIQRRLTGLQFNTRGMDGRVGEGTRRGLASWQSARGYPATGYLNRLQHEALLKEVVARAPVSAPPTAARAPESKGKQQRRGDESGDPGAAGEFVGGILKGYLNKGGRLPF